MPNAGLLRSDEALFFFAAALFFLAFQQRPIRAVFWKPNPACSLGGLARWQAPAPERFP